MTSFQGSAVESIRLQTEDFVGKALPSPDRPPKWDGGSAALHGRRPPITRRYGPPNSVETMRKSSPAAQSDVPMPTPIPQPDVNKRPKWRSTENPRKSPPEEPCEVGLGEIEIAGGLGHHLTPFGPPRVEVWPVPRRFESIVAVPTKPGVAILCFANPRLGNSRNAL